MKLGDRSEIERVFSPNDVALYERLGGATAEQGCVPEPMIAALFSYLLGVKLPGRGTNYLKQSLTFEGAAPIGEALRASVEITRLRPDKALVDLATICVGAAGRTICTGRALVRVKDVGAA